MPASSADFDKLVLAARELLASATMVSQLRWAAKAGVPEPTVRELFGDAARKEALQRVTGARWVHAEGGYFLIK